MNINPAALSALLRGDLHNAAVASTPGGIEAQEAAGQAAMVATSRLPKSGMDRAALEALGFVIGGEVNDLFVAVTLPTGWELKATGHSMHTDLIDDKGRKRGSIFYKAAFYDERADMHLLRRYKLNTMFPCDEHGNPQPYDMAEFRAICVEDGDTPLHFVAINANNRSGKRDAAYYEAVDAQEKVGRQWMDENLPDHTNPAAYWD